MNEPLTLQEAESIDECDQFADAVDQFPDNIFPRPTDYREAFVILRNAILGKDWYQVNPISYGQINSIAVSEMLFQIQYWKLPWWKKILFKLKRG